MEELRKIKKLYGEKMSHFCRENFATILEHEGVLLDILTKNFHPSRELYEDLMTLSSMDEYKNILTEFKSYIFTKYNRFETSISTTKTPKELLEEAGYILYECKTNEDVQKFKKYYAPGEELCTFNRDRTERCHVFFAVKKNAEELKRSDFNNPRRQDEYGTSVISIQFTKDDSCILSIKNRYNHTVDSCDATFSNDLDNIIEGLTDSFEKEYGLVQKFRQGKFEMPNYVKASDGKFYKYHEEINNVYYCEDNVIVDNFKVKKFDKSRYILMGYFILDLVLKEIKLYDEFILDSFPETTNDITRIEIQKEDKNKIIKLYHNDNTYTFITLKESGRISKLESNHYNVIESGYLSKLSGIDEVLLYNTEIIESHFLFQAKYISELICPDVVEICDNILLNAKKLKNISFPKLKKIGLNFFKLNEYSESINLPEVEVIGDSFFAENHSMDNIILPKVKVIGDYFLYSNDEVKVIDFPELLIAGDCFFQYGYGIESINMPKLQKLGDYCLECTKVPKIELNSLEIVGDRFLANNEELKEFSFASLKEVGDRFLSENKNVENVDLPSAISIGESFMTNNTIVNTLNMPYVVSIGEYFLVRNQELATVNLPMVMIIRSNFLKRNSNIKYISIPMVKEVESGFLETAEVMYEVHIPEDLSNDRLKPLQDWLQERQMTYDENGYYRSMTSKEYHKEHYKKGR